ncbi:hypothetical protein WJX84_012397 [Apatococcus fuscideae]|uniref:Uncharacterized protein n=1 Tax=Apatococcus fuscideae TaxID=2026836 RepID=A0AAW1T6B0_9CHLO
MWGCATVRPASRLLYQEPIKGIRGEYDVTALTGSELLAHRHQLAASIFSQQVRKILQSRATRRAAGGHSGSFFHEQHISRYQLRR